MTLQAQKRLSFTSTILCFFQMQRPHCKQRGGLAALFGPECPFKPTEIFDIIPPAVAGMVVLLEVWYYNKVFLEKAYYAAKGAGEMHHPLAWSMFYGKFLVAFRSLVTNLFPAVAHIKKELGVQLSFFVAGESTLILWTLFESSVLFPLIFQESCKSSKARFLLLVLGNLMKSVLYFTLPPKGETCVSRWVGTFHDTNQALMLGLFHIGTALLQQVVANELTYIMEKLGTLFAKKGWRIPGTQRLDRCLLSAAQGSSDHMGQLREDPLTCNTSVLKQFFTKFMYSLNDLDFGTMHSLKSIVDLDEEKLSNLNDQVHARLVAPLTRQEFKEYLKRVDNVRKANLETRRKK